MSNYHSPSTYHLNPISHLEPFAGSHDHSLPQYSYPYQNPSLLFSQGQTNGTPIAPQTHSNTRSFRSNAQDVMTPSSRNEVNGASHAPYDGQVQYNVFPTPEYPPIPFAHGVPPYGVQVFNQPTTGPNPPPNPSHLFSNPHPATEIQGADVEDPDTIPPALSELEDGELDDGEVVKAIGPSRASSMTPSRVAQHKRHENLKSADSDSSHHAVDASNKPLPGLNQDSLATPHPRDSIMSQHLGHPIPNGFINNPGDHQFSQTTESTSAQHPRTKSTIEQNPEEVNQVLVDAKMEEAKQALRDLHSQGFGFNQIVDAGLNPDLLRRLYNKIEVSVNASSNVLQPRIIKHKPESATGITHKQHPEVSQKVSVGDGSGNGTMPHHISEKAKTNGQLTLAAAKNERKSIETQASSVKSSQSPNVNLLGRASGIKPSGTKIVDRKEYIARMLAAKAGKPAVSAATPVPSQTSTITDTGAHAEARLSANPAPLVPATISQAPCDLNDPSLETPKEDLDVETKRKAQTDLARQKIEALKLRENFQQQTRSATNNNQQSPVKRAPGVPAEGSAPTSQSLPNRQSSYFSPASQKPPFNIPGLFMTSDALDIANPSKPSASDDSIVTLPAGGDATFGSSQEVLRPHAATSAERLRANKTPSQRETSLDLNSTLPAPISTMSASNRKRQRASDFIDSLSIKVKRPLPQQEDTSVIIDISDDYNSNDSSGDESSGTADRRDSLPRGPQVIAPGDCKKNTPKNLPPLTDLPQRKKSVMMTPPTAQASGQSGDLNGLKSKEMEIQVMNRKIAELEQRIATKAKQNTSRSHSPGTSSRVTTSPPSGGSSNQINNPSKFPLSLSDSQNGEMASIEKRESSTALAETIEAAAAEQLNVVQQLELVERAKAEAERSLAAQNTLTSAADPSLTREEGVQTQQAEEQLDLVKGEQQFKNEEQELAQVGEESRLEEGQSHQVCGVETKMYRQEEADLYPPEQARILEPAVLQEYSQGQERKTSLGDQWQARKSEIESGLPLLDAEVEKTRKRLESLRQEIACLEMQLQKGIEGRQGLIEELHNLSRSREALPGSMNLESCDVIEVAKQSTRTPESTAVTQSSTSVETGPKLDPTPILDTTGNGREIRELHLSKQIKDNSMSDGEVEEDIMDISRSDVDDTEPSLYSPKAVTEAQVTSTLVNDDENYEPLSELSMAQTQERNPAAVLFSQDLGIAETGPPAQTQNKPSFNPNAESIEKPTPTEQSPVASVDASSDEQSPQSQSRSPFPASASDLDEYEPPEPASLGDEVPRSTHMLSADTDALFSMRDVETDHFNAHASPVLITVANQQAQVQKLESNQQRGHFTPYESPLKQFKSFRYHPRYLEEVSGGFRSLTYSHTINPNIPLCRYELDGVCNDDSCQSQHLRSVGMSDDKILVDLGAKPDDGSSSDAFGNGLREIIHDIRSRKIRDFNIVAGEITAYRAKFLGDSSKVLPL